MHTYVLMVVGRKNDGKAGLFHFLLKPSLPLPSRRPHENDTDGLASILSSSRRRLPSLAYIVLLHRLRREGPCVVFWVGISDFKPLLCISHFLISQTTYLFLSHLSLPLSPFLGFLAHSLSTEISRNS